MMSPEPCTSSLSRVVKMVESGGVSGECSKARAVCPILGRQVRRAAMTEAQKRIGSLSNVSRESQATACSAHSALPLLACGSQEAAAHAESSVVFPLPAEAETSVNGYARTASRCVFKRDFSIALARLSTKLLDEQIAYPKADIAPALLHAIRQM